MRSVLYDDIVLRIAFSSDGRSGGNDDDRDATSSDDDNGGNGGNGRALPVSPHFGMRPLQDQLVLLARYPLTMPSLSR
jgi:hypothetical protein